MKILQVHNQYQQQGGEDAVVQMETDLLREYGHKVNQYSVDNDKIQGSLQKIRVALTVHYSKSAKERFKQVLREFKPDVVHVHNFFPTLTPSIFDACEDEAIPSVLTLHNYRLICPGALLMRDGQICELCISGSPYQAVKHTCYKGSKIGSFSVARMVQYHRNHKTWDKKVSQFIALTDFARNKFIQAGFPEDKIVVKPNFFGGSKSNLKGHRNGALFVGRISQEKGVLTMLSAWDKVNYALKIIGGGPFAYKVEETSHSSIVYMGKKSGKEVLKEMEKALFLVLPSEWYEGFPMVIVEAFASGLPVICSQLGGMEEVVEHGKTGLHFKAADADDLAGKVKWAIAHPQEMLLMGKNARRKYEELYSEEVNYKQLFEIYQSVQKAVNNAS